MLDEGRTYRQIFSDGRKLEDNPNPSWMGYSVGRWEGDTLVVESNGFSDRTWPDHDGHLHSRARALGGQASDEINSQVKIAPEILAKYAVAYEELDNWGQGLTPDPNHGL